MIKTILSDLYRLFFNKNVLLCILLVWVVCMISLEDELKYLPYENEADVIYYFNRMLDIGSFKNMILLLSGSVCAYSFCDDWNNKNINNLIIRSGKIKYSVSRFIVSGFTSFICAFTGLLLFCAFLLFFVPLYNGYSYDDTLEAPYGYVITSASPWLYLAIESANIGFNCAFWAVFGLTFSTYYSNKLFAMSCPFLGYSLVSEITEALPDFLNFRLITYSYNILEKNISVTLIYTVCFWVVLSALLLKVFVTNTQKRMENEVD